MTPPFAVNRSLGRRDFPVTITAHRVDNNAVCWAVTVLEPPGAALVPLKVPPLAKWEGVAIRVVTTTASGKTTVSHP